MPQKYSCRSAGAGYLASLCAVLAWACPGQADEADLLTTVRAAHRAARESINSLSATITVEKTFPTKEVFQAGHYWRSLGLVRVQEPRGSGADDYLLKDSEIRQVGHSRNVQGGRTHYVATRKPRTAFFCICDVWTQMLIDFPGPSGGQYDYDHFLELAKRPPRTTKERRDGRECVRVTVDFDMVSGVETTVTLWHDVGYNYLVRRLETTYGNYSDHGVAQILEFIDSGQGVFVPTKCRRQLFRHGELVNSSDTTLSEVQINRPIPKSVFRLPARPAGTVLRDEVEGTRYPVDSNWRRTGAVEPLVRAVNPGKLASEPVEYGSQSSREPISWALWVAPASLAVLAVAGGCLLYRRYRLQS